MQVRTGLLFCKRIDDHGAKPWTVFELAEDHTRGLIHAEDFASKRGSSFRCDPGEGAL